jgi:hypothetical protein
MNVKKGLFYFFVIISFAFAIFAVFDRIGTDRELTETIEKLQSAEIRVDNITEQFNQAGKIIDKLREADKQAEIAYSKLEENYRQLEDTNRKQEEIYRKFREANKIDSAAIKRIESLIKAGENITREILDKFDD